MSSKRKQRCALCGEYRLVTKDHIPPRGLYPTFREANNARRITVRSCAECNNGSADDDVHFRNVVLLAGEASPTVLELWEGPVRRSLDQVDGHRRALDIFSIMKPAPDVPGDRYRIFPADDPRILKTVRKIVRGLSHHHGIQTAVHDEQVLADVQRGAVPDELFEAMTAHDVDARVFDYRLIVSDQFPYASSLWLLRFYQRTTFIATVFKSLADRAAFDVEVSAA